MSTIRDIILEKQRNDSAFQAAQKIVRCTTVGIDFDGSPAVAGRPGFIWARESGQQGAVFQVFNPSVSYRVGLPILVSYSPDHPIRRIVYSIDWDSIPVDTADYSVQTYGVLNHSASHEWQDTVPGNDAISVYPRALVPLRVYPGSTGISISVAKGYYTYKDVLTKYPGQVDYDVSSYVPATDYNRIILAAIDAETNQISITAGTAVLIGDTLQYPSFLADTVPLAYVKLTGDDTAVHEGTIIEDVRALYSAATVTGGSSVMSLEQLVRAISDLEYTVLRHIAEG